MSEVRPSPPEVKAPTKRVKLLLGFCMSVITVGLAAPPIKDAWAGRNLSEELKLARSEGIITTKEEMEAWMGAPPSERENALPVLEEISRLPRLSLNGEASLRQQWTSAHLSLRQSLSSDTLKLALTEAAPILSLAEAACERKQIWETGDWDLGQGRPLHYYSPMRRAGNALLLRAEVAHGEGRQAQAAADVKRVLLLADLALSVRDGSGLDLGIWLRGDAEARLIKWAMHEGSDSVWVNELASAWSSQTIPDPAVTLRPQLYSWLATMDQLQTAEGRQRVGVHPEEGYSLLQGNWDDLQTVNEGKLKMVQAFRAMWKGTNEDWPSSLHRTERHEAQFIKGAMCDPYAALPFWSVEMVLPFWPHQKIAYLYNQKTLTEAVIRVLRSSKRDDKVSMAGLASPIDGSRVVLKWATADVGGGSSNGARRLHVEYEGDGHGHWSSIFLGQH